MPGSLVLLECGWRSSLFFSMGSFQHCILSLQAFITSSILGGIWCFFTAFNIFMQMPMSLKKYPFPFIKKSSISFVVEMTENYLLIEIWILSDITLDINISLQISASNLFFLWLYVNYIYEISCYIYIYKFVLRLFSLTCEHLTGTFSEMILMTASRMDGSSSFITSIYHVRSLSPS